MNKTQKDNSLIQYVDNGIILPNYSSDISMEELPISLYGNMIYAPTTKMKLIIPLHHRVLYSCKKILRRIFPAKKEIAWTGKLEYSGPRTKEQWDEYFRKSSVAFPATKANNVAEVIAFIRDSLKELGMKESK